MDTEAEKKHGKIASNPDTDIHIRKVVGEEDELEVITWWHGKRYYGRLQPDTGSNSDN